MNVDFTKYFDISRFSEEQQAEIVNAITDIVLVKLAAMIGDHLSEQEIDELDKVSQSKDPDAVINWLNKHVPNFSQGLDEVMEEERTTIAEVIERVNADLDKGLISGNPGS